MTEAELKSAAFEQALLRSEKLRIFGVVGFVVVFGCAVAIRILVFGSRMSPWGLLVLVALVAYELFSLRLVDHALKNNQQPPSTLWMLSIVLETSIPAVGIAFLASPSLEIPYRPIATPWVLAFFPLIILSILRLSPRACWAAGIVASLSYLVAATHHGWPGYIASTGPSVTQTAPPFYAAILLASGFVAGAVANEIRKHVQAALREAETTRKLERVQHDLDVARSIQQSLLPRVRPNIAGFEIGGWNHSADETGGDYFDWKVMPDGSVIVSLADVTGHGIGPALLASVCRAYSRASFNARDSLAATLANINESFGQDLTSGNFATFVAVICKADDDEVELLSAGHGPLFVYSSASDTFQMFNAQGLPLGIMPEFDSDASVKLSLKPGDLVLLITDGFFEWENAEGEQFGADRLAETVRKSSHLGPEEIIAELYLAVLDFSKGTKQKDDLTAVIIKRTGESKPKPQLVTR